MTGERLCAVSVDLDGLSEYRKIYDLTPVDGDDPVYRRAVGRLCELADGHGIPLTLFAVGKDLECLDNSSRLRLASSAGHLVENHSYGHRYDLTRLPRAEMLRDIERAQRIIETAVGRAPVGFRAPGYTVTDELLDVLSELGMSFDSSVFPCPPYYLTKTLVMAGLRLTGRRSRSIIDTPKVLLAPREPYIPQRPWYRRGYATGARSPISDHGSRRLLELPIGVTPRLGLPVIGTSLTMVGLTGARWLIRGCIGEPLVNLELHGIDVLDSTDSGMSDVASHQPDVKIPTTRKRRVLSAVIGQLKSSGYRFVTLAAAAEILASRLHLPI